MSILTGILTIFVSNELHDYSTCKTGGCLLNLKLKYLRIKVCVIWKVDDAHHATPEITNHLCRRAHSVVISGHVTRHVVDFSNYTDFRILTRVVE